MCVGGRSSSSSSSSSSSRILDVTWSSSSRISSVFIVISKQYDSNSARIAHIASIKRHVRHQKIVAGYLLAVPAGSLDSLAAGGGVDVGHRGVDSDSCTNHLSHLSCTTMKKFVKVSHTVPAMWLHTFLVRILMYLLFTTRVGVGGTKLCPTLALFSLSFSSSVISHLLSGQSGQSGQERIRN